MVTLNGGEHLLTKTSIIFCPAGMPHMRIGIRRVGKPLFHFSVVIQPRSAITTRMESEKCSERGF